MHLITDPRSLAALDVVERFANGQASLKELGAANAAWVAAWANAAWAAAWANATDRAASRASQIQELKRVLACTEAGIDPYPPQKD